MRLPQDSEYIAAKEAASILGVSNETLRSWRYAGKHLDLLPPHIYLNKWVFYKKADVERFIEKSMTAVVYH